MGRELVICLNMVTKIMSKKDWFNWVGNLKKNFVHGNYNSVPLSEEPCGAPLD